jgi:predicted SprT family Zn-dependent metalloprotease
LNIQAKVNELLISAGCKPNVTVKIANFGITAGDVDGYGTTMRINKQVIDNYPQHLEELIIHETAHVVDIQRHGFRKDSRGRYIHHDKVFFDICRELGDPNPSTTYDEEMQLKSVRKFREFEYSCGCLSEDGSPKAHIVKTPTHNKIQKRHAVYQCRTCKEEFSKHNFIREVK